MYKIVIRETKEAIGEFVTVDAAISAACRTSRKRGIVEVWEGKTELRGAALSGVFHWAKTCDQCRGNNAFCLVCIQGKVLDYSSYG